MQTYLLYDGPGPSAGLADGIGSCEEPTLTRETKRVLLWGAGGTLAGVWGFNVLLGGLSPWYAAIYSLVWLSSMTVVGLAVGPWYERSRRSSVSTRGLVRTSMLAVLWLLVGPMLAIIWVYHVMIGGVSPQLAGIYSAIFSAAALTLAVVIGTVLGLWHKWREHRRTG